MYIVEKQLKYASWTDDRRFGALEEIVFCRLYSCYDRHRIWQIESITETNEGVKI